MYCDIFVGNLNPEVRTDDLGNVFDKYGKVIRIDLKGRYAFIQFEKREDAKEAIKKEHKNVLFGSTMTVQWTRPRSMADKYDDEDRRPRSSGRSGRNESRDRSPIRRSGSHNNPRFSSRQPRARNRDDRYQRRSFEEDSFDRGNPRFDDRPSRNRYDKDRGQYSRGPPMRDASPRGNRYMDGPPYRGDRRDRGPTFDVETILSTLGTMLRYARN